MTYSQAIQFLHGLRMFGARLGLENSYRLAELAGRPQDKLLFIHVAGTNGKGSTCAMLESIYRAAGLRVGLFTSPHLVSFRERMQVNRQPIAEGDVTRLVGEMRELIATNVAVETKIENSRLRGDLRDGPYGRPPPSTSDGTPDTTFFEFITVVALRYFAEQQCDLVIWETGLGGRLDATNIVTPLASVITNIGFDHQEWLGDTLDKIAAEKAGIIKPRVPVITGAEPAHGLEIIAEIAQHHKAPFFRVGQASRLPRRVQSDATCLTVEEALAILPLSEAGGGPALPLPGEHQRLNAALAAATVRALRERISVQDGAIIEGLTQVFWPGRMQWIKRPGGQGILLDGAHNPDGVAALGAALRNKFSGANPTVLLGVLADKDWKTIAGQLARLAGRLVLVPVNSARTLAPEVMAPICREANPGAPVSVGASLAAGLEQTKDDPFVVITGSLYLVGEAMELLHLSAVPVQDERGLNEWGRRREKFA